MCKKLFPLVFILVLSFACTSYVSAAIIYVDATEGQTGNTTLASGGVFTSTADASGSDNLWRGRAFANSATIFESGGQGSATANTEDCPRLKTSITVPQGYYNVYVYIWADTSTWRLRASLIDSVGELPLFIANDPNSLATVADANDFDAPVPLLSEGNRTLWQAHIGTTDLTETIDVYVDDDPNHLTNNSRTWYDGIGYKALPPQIVYVDASEGETGNTKLASGEVFKSVPDNSGSDNIWRGRAFGNSATIFESGGTYGETANPEDCPRLMTSVDVPAFDYNVYAYFWSDTTANGWRIRASLTNSEGKLPIFIATDPNSLATIADVNDFFEPVPLVTEGNRTLWQASLGTTGVTTSINVYIDDDPNHQSQNRRTWYDGIGYKVVVPKIVYVDATDGEAGNTRLTTGEVLVAPDPGNNGSGDDGLWRKRAFGNGPSIFESCGDYRNAPYDTEDCPRLVTSVDVPENIYEVFAYFWDTNSSWRLRAYLENCVLPLPLFLPNDPNGLATKADANDFAAPVPLVTTSGNRIMWQAPLGRTGLTTKIAVYADDDPNTRDSNKRTWYDGIGYKLVSGLEVEPEVIVPPPPPPPPPPVVLPDPVDPGIAGGLVAYYAFENNMLDSSGNGFNGTVVGNPAFTAGLAGYGTAIDFDTADEYIDCGNNPAFDITGQITVSAWVNIRTVATEWAPIASKGEKAWRLSGYGSAMRSFHFGINDWQTVPVYAANGNTQIPLNEWHHVCGTYDGASIKLYLDALVDATAASTAGIGVTPATNLFINHNLDYTTRYWNGGIDEVRVYNRALSQAEVVYLAKK